LGPKKNWGCFLLLIVGGVGGVNKIAAEWSRGKEMTDDEEIGGE